MSKSDKKPQLYCVVCSTPLGAERRNDSRFCSKLCRDKSYRANNQKYLAVKEKKRSQRRILARRNASRKRHQMPSETEIMKECARIGRILSSWRISK